MSTVLTAAEKEALASKIKQFLADECDMDVADIKDSTDIQNDLKADSLVFLELIQELQQDGHLKNMDIRKIGKYIVKHPVKTVGEAIDVLYVLIEKGEAALED